MIDRIEQIIDEEFYSLPDNKKPGAVFSDILSCINGMECDRAVILLENILYRINEKRNRFYIKAVFDVSSEIIENNFLFFIDACNTALDHLFMAGDMKNILWLLKKIDRGGDARTVAILDHYIHLYRDKSVISRLTGFRNRYTARIAAVGKKLDKMSMVPIMTEHLTWQE